MAAERAFDENRFFAFGADATLRMKRVADAPMDLGDRGPPDRDVGGVDGRANDAWEGFAVSALGRAGARPRAMRCFSDFVRARDLTGVTRDCVSADCCWCAYEE